MSFGTTCEQWLSATDGCFVDRIYLTRTAYDTGFGRHLKPAASSAFTANIRTRTSHEFLARELIVRVCLTGLPVRYWHYALITMFLHQRDEAAAATSFNGWDPLQIALVASAMVSALFFMVLWLLQGSTLRKQRRLATYAIYRGQRAADRANY